MGRSFFQNFAKINKVSKNFQPKTFQRKKFIREDENGVDGDVDIDVDDSNSDIDDDDDGNDIVVDIVGLSKEETKLD